MWRKKINEGHIFSPENEHWMIFSKLLCLFFIYIVDISKCFENISVWNKVFTYIVDTTEYIFWLAAAGAVLLLLRMTIRTYNWCCWRYDDSSPIIMLVYLRQVSFGQPSYGCSDMSHIGITSPHDDDLLQYSNDHIIIEMTYYSIPTATS